MQLIAYSQFTDARQSVEVDKLDVITVGRDDDNTLALPSPFVSRHHAKLSREDGNFFLENVGLNGITLRGETIGVGARLLLHPGLGPLDAAARRRRKRQQ